MFNSKNGLQQLETNINLASSFLIESASLKRPTSQNISKLDIIIITFIILLLTFFIIFSISIYMRCVNLNLKNELIGKYEPKKKKRKKLKLFHNTVDFV